MQKTDNGVEKPEKFVPKYFVQPATCGTKDHIQTVRSWLDQFGIPAEDEFYGLWTEAITFVAEFFHSIEAMKVTEGTLNPLWSVAFSELYVNYDAEKELIPQFLENATKLRDGFSKIKVMAEEFFGGLPDGK